MTDFEKFANIEPDSASVQTHLSIIQNSIQRMAGNSSSCKAWCVTLISAILVIVADKGKPEFAWIALFPTLFFACLDTYYLALEKGFINLYNIFVSKLHNKNLSEKDLYSVTPVGDNCKLFIQSVKSPSVWGFYVSLVILIFITKNIAIN